MRVLSSSEAYKNLAEGIKQKTFMVPSKLDASQYRDGSIFPRIKPEFSVLSGEKIFTIGSCFARNIEAALIQAGMDVPVARFMLPDGEIHHLAPHILNEYNAGTILQRIESVAGAFGYGEDMGIEETPKGFLDLFLHIHSQPVTLARLQQRRLEIRDLYAQLLDCSTIIITLGLVECWYDTKHKCYLNKAPSRGFAAREAGRFEFRRLDVEDVLSRMREAILLLRLFGDKKILLTVSPVPIEATFTGQHAVLSNTYSKSVLRITCEALKTEFHNVDYFPSYEIVVSGGTSNFAEDNVHVRDDIVERIAQFMISTYSGDRGLVAEEEETAIELYWHSIRSTYDHGDLEEGKAAAERLVRRFPEDWHGYDALGHYFSSIGDTAQAIKCTRMALQRDSGNEGLATRLQALTAMESRQTNVTDDGGGL